MNKFAMILFFTLLTGVGSQATAADRQLIFHHVCSWSNDIPFFVVEDTNSKEFFPAQYTGLSHWTRSGLGRWTSNCSDALKNVEKKAGKHCVKKYRNIVGRICR